MLDASRSVPVLVDFWAPWCGPCKQLTPILEKAVTPAKGKVRLVKMNIDDHPQIAGQLGIQSIPAVIAFKNGQPLDGFMGALPESQVTAFIDRVAGPTGPSSADEALEAAAEALAAKDYAGAAVGVRRRAAGAIRKTSQRSAGLVRCLCGARRAGAGARSPRRAHARSRRRMPQSRAPRAALELAAQAEKLGKPSDLAKRVSKPIRTTTRPASTWRSH